MESKESQFRILPYGDMLNINYVIKTYIEGNEAHGYNGFASLSDDTYIRITETFPTKTDAQKAVLELIEGYKGR